MVSFTLRWQSWIVAKGTIKCWLPALLQKILPTPVLDYKLHDCRHWVCLEYQHFLVPSVAPSGEKVFSKYLPDERERISKVGVESSKGSIACSAERQNLTASIRSRVRVYLQDHKQMSMRQASGSLQLHLWIRIFFFLRERTKRLGLIIILWLFCGIS